MMLGGGGNDAVNGGGLQQQEQRQQDSHSRRQLVAFHITGFGIFNGVSDNPTTHLIKELPGELHARCLPRRRAEQSPGQKNVVEKPVGRTIPSEDVVGDGFEVRSYEVLEVSAKGGGRQLRELFSRASAENLTTQKAVVPNITCSEKTNTESGDVGDGGDGHDGDVISVFVHCGVNAAANKFAVETQGFNEATFGAADEQGYHPISAPIDEANSDTNHCRTTTLPVGKVLENLEGMGWGPDFVADSKDAGRFVCNFVYYTSLGLCETKVAEAAAAAGAGAAAAAVVDDNSRRVTCDKKRWHSLFVHVPLFSVISKEKQLAFMADFLSATTASLVETGVVSTEVSSKNES